MTFGSRALRRWMLSLLALLVVIAGYSPAFAADRLVLEPLAEDPVTTDPDVRYGDFIRASDGGFVAAGIDVGDASPKLFMARWDASGELKWKTLLDIGATTMHSSVNDLIETPNGYMFVGSKDNQMLYGLIGKNGAVVRSGVQPLENSSAQFIVETNDPGTMHYLVGGYAVISSGSGTVDSIFMLDENGNSGAGIAHLINHGRIAFGALEVSSGKVMIVGYASGATGQAIGTLYPYDVRSGAGDKAGKI